MNAEQKLFKEFQDKQKGMTPWEKHKLWTIYRQKKLYLKYLELTKGKSREKTKKMWAFYKKEKQNIFERSVEKWRKEHSNLKQVP